jgi:hypothetical protein
MMSGFHHPEPESKWQSAECQHDFPYEEEEEEEEEEIQQHAISRKSHGYNLLGLKIFIIFKFLPRGTTANCDHYTETLSIYTICLHQVHPRRKRSALLLLNGTRPHTTVRTTEIITKFCSVVTPPYSSDLIPTDFQV